MSEIVLVGPCRSSGNFLVGGALALTLRCVLKSGHDDLLLKFLNSFY
jgi:hypothetical protein